MKRNLGPHLCLFLLLCLHLGYLLTSSLGYDLGGTTTDPSHDYSQRYMERGFVLIMFVLFVFFSLYTTWPKREYRQAILLGAATDPAFYSLTSVRFSLLCLVILQGFIALQAL